jgi:hypothetical protein
MTHDHINPDRFADSAGVPWAGRSFEANPFAEDDGSADPALIAAIQSFRETQNPAEVFRAATTARFLIPLVANLGEAGEGAHGQTVDKSADLSIVTVQAPDGANALPIFSSVAAMQKWNPQARPVPADAVRVAIAAASEGNTRIVLDATGETEFVFRRPAIAALGQNLQWQAPHLNNELTEALAISARRQPEVLDVEFGTEDPFCRLQGAELVVRLKLAGGLGQTKLQEVVANVTRDWTALGNLNELIDDLKVIIAPSF